MTEEQTEYKPDPPAPKIKRRSRWQISAVWLVPLVAILVGAGLAVHSIAQRGPTISITFRNAQWLTAGQTKLKYKNVVVGHVTSIGFDDDFQNVLVKVALQRDASRVAQADSRFWVVHPRVDLGGVSGLRTLVSGAYIEVDLGPSKQRKTHFVALSQPPPILHDRDGKRYMLHATEAGSLNVGSRVYYRRFVVGRVTGKTLDPDGKGVQVDVFVRAPYDKFVRESSHFWNASGIDVTLGTSGLKVNTQALASILAGGVAFGQRPGDDSTAPAPGDSRFELYPSKDIALASPDGPSQIIRMRFNQSVRGLDTGAEVDFRGISIGHVTGVKMQFDPVSTIFRTNVDAVVYPNRLGLAQAELKSLGKAGSRRNTHLIGTLVKHGMRAQLRTANLISGKLYVALDFFPDAPAVKFDAAAKPVVIPTRPGSLEQLQQQVTEIVRKLDGIPFADLGQELSTTLKRTNALLSQLNGHLTPQATATLKEAQATLAQARETLEAAQNGLSSPNSPLRRNVGHTLQQVQDAAQSLQGLVDYLQRHPSALLRGRAPDATPPSGDRP